MPLPHYMSWQYNQMLSTMMSMNERISSIQLPG